MHKSHLKWILVLCLAPVGLYMIFQAAGIGLGRGVLLLMLIICPLSHFLMMRGKSHIHGGDKTVEAEKVGVNAKKVIKDDKRRILDSQEV